MVDPLGIGGLIYGVFFLLYWGVALYLLYVAVTRLKSTRGRAIAILLVVAAFGSMPALTAYQDWQTRRYRDAAQAHFDKRCTEDAVEKINRVAENVEGLFIAKPRVRATEAELNDQYWRGDPYGYSSYEAEHQAGTYLYDRSGKTISDVVFTPIKGYKFVEMSNPTQAAEGSALPYLRYTLKQVDARNTYGEVERRLQPVAEEVNKLRSRYAITWDDISTAEDRKYWIAGGSLTVFDVSTNEVLGQRIGYVVDPYLGRATGGRRIWLHVNRFKAAFCPSFEKDFDKNKEFVAKVLKRQAGNANGK